MKKNSKNKSSDINSNKYKKNSESKNDSKSSYYSHGRDTSRKSTNYKKKPFKNKNEIYQLNTKAKKENNYISSKRSNTSHKSNFEYVNKEINFKELPNKKIFDDWIWGKHSVYSALKSERAINRIWCTTDIFSSEKFYILLKELKLKGVLIEEVSWNRISQLTNGAAHQGIALQLAHSNSISLNKLIELSKVNSKNPIILALDGITDPHNLGAIIRSAEAFDCKGIVIPQRRSAGLTGTVAKVAAGALEHIPVSRVVNLNRSLEELKKHGFLTIGLCGNSKMPLSEFNVKGPFVVIVGSEDRGISLLTQKKCDYLVKIPLKGKTSSLNASVASAISLFHLTNM